ncbi:MAG: hypothetical protein IK151_03550 [Erysipelotrichaceae bacterium]|nr:hypothetical protein [Erysipelotrichaceae bacterium]
MINKYTLSRAQELKYVRENLDTLVSNSVALSRYSEDDPLKAVAERNFYDAFEFILNNPEVENDYKCLVELHAMLMKDLDSGIKSELNETQIKELNEMINQPTKANLEVAIDVLLYILDKRLFVDGDVRAAMLFANKFMVDNGCGIITVPVDKKDVFREKLKEYKESKDYDIKDWVYKYCVKGPKLDY